MNLVQEKKCTDRLIEALRKYHNRMIESSKVIKEMIQMAKDMQEAMKRHEELGLNPDEEASYHVLADRREVLLFEPHHAFDGPGVAGPKPIPMNVLLMNS